MNVTAFFDLDYTLLNTSSGLAYIREITKQNRVPLWIIGQIGLKYQLKRLDFGQAHLQLMNYVGRRGHRETKKFFDTWVPKRLFPCLSPVGRARIEWHQSRGHRVVIISASIQEIVKPVTEHLGLGQNYLCTRLAVEDDRYTGKLAGPLCYGSGKVHWVKQWAMENNLDFPDSVGYFYTDSSSDLPLLELADYPVAVNPSRRLAKIARARGWKIERFY